MCSDVDCNMPTQINQQVLFLRLVDMQIADHRHSARCSTDDLSMTVQCLVCCMLQVLVDMDSTCLAMLMWSLPRLKLRPSEQFLQQCLTTTSAQLPQMTLLSITSVLAALQALGYLPPVSWMVETCQAARVKVNTDVTPKKWQRRACVRRLEETVKWFNDVTMQQQQGANIDRDSRELEDRSMQRRAVGAVLKGAAGILGAGNTSSEALIAAAVGVAAAVAQQWRW